MYGKLLLLAVTALMGLSTFAWAEASQIHVTVKGMVCAFCAQGITKKFSADPAVSHVDVSLEKKSVDLSLKNGQAISDESIRKTLTEAGYDVEKIERK